MPVQIQLRGDTAANWTASNPILADRELGLETDTRLSKMGDGVTTWSALSYFTGIITTAQLDAKSDLASPQFTGAPVSSTISPLVSGANIATDMSLGNDFTVTLDVNAVLDNPTGRIVGQAGSIIVTQDATGNRTLAFGSHWKFAGGIAPILTLAANAVDRIDYQVVSSANIHAVATLDIR